MTFTAEHQPAKGRGPSKKATQAEVSEAWCRLRSAAGNGDIQASALLIALAERRPLLSSLPA
ncbi:hypothetical protein [Pseudomonas sp. NA-150]|uniref:hypothetical protein n=1 Tax=Pseudomonas sp. NA-150 TaxID=3367525 RepID=UPI0037CBBB73